jgi:error-prone DNA polymerase
LRAGDKAEPQATSRLCGRISASVTYAHPLLEHVLRRTLGVPLFQEQLIRMAMIVANFSGREAEELRRAMGMRRSQARMRELEAKLRKGHDRQRSTGRKNAKYA